MLNRKKNIILNKGFTKWHVLLLFFYIFYGLSYAQKLSIQRTTNQGEVKVVWTNDGVLEKTTKLVPSDWQMFPTVSSPYKESPDKTSFFRLNLNTNAAVADCVVSNALIYTVNTLQPWAEAMAIKNGKIIFVGSNTNVSMFVGATTHVVNVQGRLIMPGFQDVHLHIIEAGINENMCLLSQFGTEADYRLELADCLAEQTGTGWVLGAGVNMEALMDSIASPISVLDDVITNRPALILDDLGHGVWVNTLAMQAVGFHTLSNNPQGGIILRDTGNQPIGVVLENPVQTFSDAAFPPTTANLDSAYEYFTNSLYVLASHGITTVSDAGGYWPRGHEKVWMRAETAGVLTVRASNALYVYPDKPYAAQLTDLKARFTNESNKKVRFNQAKIYIDGIVSQATAALYEPYEASLGLPPEEQFGFEYFKTNELYNYVKDLESHGFQIHFHVTGDRAVDIALDTIEMARSANNITNRRHRLTHLYMINSNDFYRFSSLGVFADFQLAPSSLESGYLNEIRTFIGNRVDQYLPAGSLLNAGANLTLSSDWDADEISPLKKIQTVLTRATEGIPDVATAVKLMTLNPARLLHHDDKTGSLEVGKYADYVVIDQDIFTLSVTNIGQAKVEATVLEGHVVYDPGNVLD